MPDWIGCLCACRLEPDIHFFYLHPLLNLSPKMFIYWACLVKDGCLISSGRGNEEHGNTPERHMGWDRDKEREREKLWDCDRVISQIRSQLDSVLKREAKVFFFPWGLWATVDGFWSQRLHYHPLAWRSPAYWTVLSNKEQNKEQTCEYILNVKLKTNDGIIFFWHFRVYWQESKSISQYVCTVRFT